MRPQSWEGCWEKHVLQAGDWMDQQTVPLTSRPHLQPSAPQSPWPQRSTTNSNGPIRYLRDGGKIDWRAIHTSSIKHGLKHSKEAHTHTHTKTRYRKLNQEIGRAHSSSWAQRWSYLYNNIQGFISESTLGLTQDTGPVRSSWRANTDGWNHSQGPLFHHHIICNSFEFNLAFSEPRNNHQVALHRNAWFEVWSLVCPVIDEGRSDMECSRFLPSSLFSVPTCGTVTEAQDEPFCFIFSQFQKRQVTTVSCGKRKGLTFFSGMKVNKEVILHTASTPHLWGTCAIHKHSLWLPLTWGGYTTTHKNELIPAFPQALTAAGRCLACDQMFKSLPRCYSCQGGLVKG